MNSNLRIQDYSFGKIIVDGRLYQSDIIIYPDHIDDEWWRESGHYLNISDLPFLDKKPPEILIIGQGRFGLMKVSEELRGYLKENLIEYRIEKTAIAVDIYNSLWEKGNRNIVAALHLTC